jgi:hypothetical protein
LSSTRFNQHQPLMHVWRSLSRCLSQPGYAAVPVCCSSPSLYLRCHLTRHNSSSSSTKEGSSNVPKAISLSQTLKLMEEILLSNASRKEPLSPEHTTLMKSKPPKKTKLKRRVVPREREPRKRLNDRRGAKQLPKKIEDPNREISFESVLIHDWKGIFRTCTLNPLFSIFSC